LDSEVGKPILMANSQKKLIDAISGGELTKSSKEHGVAIKLDALLKQNTL